MRTLFFVGLSLFVALLFSCEKKSDEAIIFDSREPLALAPDMRWAVVTEPYATYRTETSWNSPAAGYCRKGDILQVLGVVTAKESGVWYKFEGGWLFESSVAIYSNRYKAQTYSSAQNGRSQNVEMQSR